MMRTTKMTMTTRRSECKILRSHTSPALSLLNNAKMHLVRLAQALMKISRLAVEKLPMRHTFILIQDLNMAQ